MTYVSCFYHAFSGAQKVSWAGALIATSCPHHLSICGGSPGQAGAIRAECWLGKTSSHSFPVAGGARRLPWFGQCGMFSLSAAHPPCEGHR